MTNLLSSICQLDTDALLFINSIRAEWLDGFMYGASGRLVWVPFYVILALLLWRRFGWRRAVLGILMIGVAVLITDQLCASLIRPAIERLRPTNPQNPISSHIHTVFGYRGGAYGFPSCHAANSCVLTVAYSLLYRNRVMTIILVAWTLLLCWTRMYLGVHYPGDLIVGLIIGSLVAIACFKLFKLAEKVSYRQLLRRLIPSGPRT